MRFYQMDEEAVVSALFSSSTNGLPDQENINQPEIGKKSVTRIKGIVKEIRRKFLPMDILPLICYVIAVVFSVLNRNWDLLIMASTAIGISLFTYVSLAAVLYHYRSRFKTHLDELNHTVLVLRGGKEKEISFDQLLVGDVLILRKGMLLHADARVLSSENLYADENYVFSTSLSARKSSDAISEPNLLPEMQENMLWKGSYIAEGNGRAIVTALNEDCYIEKTGGRTSTKQHSWFYNKQNNFGQFVSLAYILLVLLSLLIAVIATFRFVEVIFLFGVMSSIIMLNPVSLLTEWNYYRTAEVLYQKGAHIRNIEAFDGMNKEKNLYYSLDELIDGHLSFEKIIPIEGDYQSCISYFSLCVGVNPISSLLIAPLNEFGLSYEQLDRSYPLYHTEKDDNGTIFSVFANEGRSIVVAAGYWQSMIPYIGKVSDDFQNQIDDAENCGRMVWLLAVASMDSIPNQLDLSGFFGRMNLMCMANFEISKDKETAQKIFELQKSKSKVFLVNSYHQRLGDFVAKQYGVDHCLSSPPENPCYTLPHLKKNPYVVCSSASPIAQKRAHLVLSGDISPQEVIYRVKCMFCGIKRSLSFIACFCVLMLATMLTLFLKNVPLESVVYPVLLMKLALICPCYYLTETVGNCNKYTRSLVLGSMCGLMGFLPAVLGFDSALLSMGLSTVFLCLTLLLSVRQLRPLRMKDLYILLASLLVIVLPWSFIGGNWIAAILFACFPAISAYIINLFY